jgi:Domain of unknown function (DUF4185)
MRTSIRLLVAAFAASLFAFVLAASGETRTPAPPPNTITLAGSSHKVCQLTGDSDHQFQPPQPTASQTVTDWGLTGTDNGYSFQWNGKLWFLFGDSPPTPLFNGQANKQTDPPRTPTDNDSIAFTSPQWSGQCPKLSFVQDSIGAFTNPVVMTAPGQAPVTLRTNEVPIAGIDVGQRMYVIFGTDNFASNPPGQPPSPRGGPTRSVIAVLEDASTLQFKYLYDLSTSNGKFVFDAITPGAGGYVYFWGVEGGPNNYRHSPLFFARKKAANIGHRGGMEYFHGFDQRGKPIFRGQESAAVPLFSDNPDCMGEHSVQWNPYVQRWVLLYNCSDDNSAHPRGIWMRLAKQPWGPWTQPQTIFAATSGLCIFIHRAVTASHPQCDNLSTPDRLGVQGGNYSPDIIAPFTTGVPAAAKTRASSTFYYTMSTWNPYQVVIMSTSIEGPPSR